MRMERDILIITIISDHLMVEAAACTLFPSSSPSMTEEIAAVLGMYGMGRSSGADHRYLCLYVGIPTVCAARMRKG